MSRALIRTVTTALAAIWMSFGAGGGAAYGHPAWGIAADRRGQVYFSDLVTVWKIDARGKLSALRVGKDHTHDLNLDEDGNLYGAENAYDPTTQRFFSAVWKITPAGGFSYLLDLTDDPPEGTSIWKDEAGNAYHATYHPGRELLVLKKSPDGNLTTLVGNRDAVRNYRQGVPYSTGGMAFGPDGALYFVHGANVSKVAKSGVLTALARNVTVQGVSGKAAGGGRSPLFGIAVDARGNAFVADHGNRRVLKISPGGQMTTFIRSEQSWFPTGVAVRGSELYILEESHTPDYKPLGTRVSKRSRDGKVTVLATVRVNKVSSETSSTGENSPAGSFKSAAGPKNRISSATGSEMFGRCKKRSRGVLGSGARRKS